MSDFYGKQFRPQQKKKKKKITKEKKKKKNQKNSGWEVGEGRLEGAGLVTTGFVHLEVLLVVGNSSYYQSLYSCSLF
jgi:hypothetical protein